MNTVDYFLYDNRTRAPRIGRDWGFKAATGVLAARSDLAAIFDRYRAAQPADRGYLNGFTQALGGFRSPTGDGYVLCITLETSDYSGRPSFAVYGLWCPDRATLETVLRSDPVASAKAILGAETPPRAFALKPGLLSFLPKRRLATGNTAFHRFDRKSTVADVTSILLGAIRTRTTLPNILGITASSQLSTIADNFDLIYCHPLDDRSREAFERVQSAQELLDEPIDSPPVIPEQAAVMNAVPANPRSPTAAIPWVAGLTTGAVAIAATIFLIIETSPQWLVFVPADAEPPAPVSAKPTSPSMLSEPEPVIQNLSPEIPNLLTEIQNLDPEELRNEPSYRAVERNDVIGAHSDNHKEVRAAYSSLIDIGQHVVGGKDAAYYEAQSKMLAESCAVLGKAFRFELDKPDSALRRRCDLVARLESAARSVQTAASDSPDPVSGRTTS